MKVRVCVLPSDPRREAEDPYALNVVLEPGLAFGTGEHPTTRLCLGWLKTNGMEGQYVMDFGTGSGVLAIGALLMGADRAVGVDIDHLSAGVTFGFSTTRRIN
jgi:ribosomal protein L11 methyltransferase